MKSKFQMSGVMFSLMILFVLVVPTVKVFSVFDLFLFSSTSTEFSVTFIFDESSVMFGVVISLISSCVFLFAKKYMEMDIFFWRFMWILMMFVISMMVLIFAGSFLTMLLGWDGLGVTSFVLIIYYQSQESLMAGFKTLLINRLGDVLIVCSFVTFLYSGCFYYCFSLTSITYTFMVILSIAGLTKSAQYPFSSWLPAAMAAPTPVSALVHSSTLVTAGIYLIIRMMSGELLADVLLFLGALTCFLGGTAALFEYDLKKVIALSTLSQLGLMVFSLGLGLSNLALFHLFTHALFKAMLFLAAGSVLIMSFGTQDLRLLGGVMKFAPLQLVAMNVGALCLAGAPFLNAFYSKHAILDKMIISNFNFFSCVIMVLGTVATSAYMVRLMKTLLWGNPMSSLVMKSTDLEVYFPVVLLASGSVFSGHLMSTMDYFLESSSFMSSLINFLPLLGVVVGLFLSSNHSYMFSSLFFLAPFYNNSGVFLNKMLMKMKVLDYGWLEFVYFLKSSIFGVEDKILSLASWPKFDYVLLRVFLMFIFLAVVSSCV